MRLWSAHKTWVDPGCAAALCHDDPGATPRRKAPAPVRLHHGIRQPEGTEDWGTTPHRDAKPLPLAPDAPHSDTASWCKARATPPP